jgi:hypothetical protein
MQFQQKKSSKYFHFHLGAIWPNTMTARLRGFLATLVGQAQGRKVAWRPFPRRLRLGCDYSFFLRGLGCD